MGALFWKYLDVVPSVFSARGELYGLRLLVPRCAALDHLRETAVLTLDSATEAFGGFRIGRARNDYAYFASESEVVAVESAGLAVRRPGSSFPFAWTPPDREMLFAVVPRRMPASAMRGGARVVTRGDLIRDLIGFYGLRVDVVAAIEAKLGESE